MAAYLPNLQKDNISLYTIPAFWFIALAPRLWAIRTYRLKSNEDMDGRAPRQFAKTIQESAKLDSTSKGRLSRAEAASSNGFENFGLYAAAVTAGSVAGLSPAFLNGTALAYLASRVVFNVVYVVNETKEMALVRSATYMAGMGLLFSLFVSAGNKLRETLVI